VNASFGIDHPLIAVHDIEMLRDRLVSLGFNMTGIGKHPWGTSTCLAMFDGCLIEIMGIYDDTLLDEIPAGDFRFGRHVHTHLQDREGVALTALHSTDSVADAAHAQQAGFTVSGHLEFGRDVVLPDGQAGRTKTTLALLPDTQWPRLSFFLCQQHRPELIYVPEWLEHPNSVSGICGITILASQTDHTALRKKLEGLYGPCTLLRGGFLVDTANGPMRIQDRASVEAELGELTLAISDRSAPCIVAIDLQYNDEKTFRRWIKNSGFAYFETNDTIVLAEPNHTGNTILRFCHSAIKAVSSDR
jgi:hypothetical protein